MLITSEISHTSDAESDNPDLQLCYTAQTYYTQHGLATRVKACAATSIEQILRLVGVHAHTIDPVHLDVMAVQWRSEAELRALSLFGQTQRSQYDGSLSYGNDKARFQRDFAASGAGRGAQGKLDRVGSHLVSYLVALAANWWLGLLGIGCVW